MFRTETGLNDVALLRLENPFTLSDFVIPACLPPEDEGLFNISRTRRCFVVGPLASQAESGLAV